MVEGETELLYAAPSVDPRDVRRRRVLVCQSTPTSDLSIRTGQTTAEPAAGAPGARPPRAAGGAARSSAPTWPGSGSASRPTRVFRPGQHAILDLGDGLRRCYSLAGQPGSREVSFIAKRYAGRPGSGRLFAVGEGEEVALELPYGDMFLRRGGRPGGARGRAAPASRRSWRWPSSSRGAGTDRACTCSTARARVAELVCWDELGRAMGEPRPAATCTAPCSTRRPAGPAPPGSSPPPWPTALPRLADAVFYVAGPPPMTDATLDLLRHNGIQLDRVHYDSFG